MRISGFGTAITLIAITVSGCSGSSTKAQPDASVPADASATRDDFELQGSWLFLGPGDVMHSVVISNSSAVYTGNDGDWSSTWSIKDYDNDLQRFQLTFKSGTGSYYPTGQNLSGTYDLSGILTVQLADGLGSYLTLQSPGSCTVSGTQPIPNCALYMKQN